MKIKFSIIKEEKRPKAFKDLPLFSHISYESSFDRDVRGINNQRKVRSPTALPTHVSSPTANISAKINTKPLVVPSPSLPDPPPTLPPSDKQAKDVSADRIRRTISPILRPPAASPGPTKISYFIINPNNEDDEGFTLDAHPGYIGSIFYIPDVGYYTTKLTNSTKPVTIRDELERIQGFQGKSITSDGINYYFNYTFDKAIKSMFQNANHNWPSTAHAANADKLSLQAPPGFEDQEKPDQPEVTLPDASQSTTPTQYLNVLKEQALKLSGHGTSSALTFADYIASADEIASLAAMIKIETSGVQRYSPMGTAAVAFQRMQDANYSGKMSILTAGPSHALAPDEEIKPGNSWNPGRGYIRDHKAQKEVFKRYLLTKALPATVAEYSELTKGFPRTTAALAQYNKEITGMASNNAAHYKKILNLAIYAYENKEKIQALFQNAISFIHPSGMTKLSPLGSYKAALETKKKAEKKKATNDKLTQKERLSLKSKPANKRKSGNKYPYNFTTQEFYELTDPGKDKEELAKTNKKSFEIENNPKQDGLRYIPKWVANAIQSKKAFFIKGEHALFIKK